MAERAGFDPSEVFVYRGRGSIRRNVRRVEVDRNVKFIPDRLFAYCDQLEWVHLRKGLLRIGVWAFAGCSSLRNIHIPSTVTEIGKRAFARCRNLPTVDLPESLESIEDETFYMCTSLAEVKIPASVTTIGSSAFYGCTNLRSVELRQGLRMIGWRAFKFCPSLESLRVPSSVDEIEEEAFGGCSGLSLIRLRERLSTLGRYAFRGCPPESFRFVRLSERREAISMDDQTKSMFESRLREITRALTRGEEDEDESDEEEEEDVNLLWEKCKKSLERAHEFLTYVELNGSMPVLELALWKAKIGDEREEQPPGEIADDEDGGQDARDAGRARQHGPQLSREDCRVKSGAGIVSAEVRKFFAYKTSWPRLDDLE